jgi:molecular chaperone HscB
MKTYFEIFNIPQSYNLNLDELEGKYLQLQKEFHPDKLVNKSDGERLILANLSADVNDAYQILKSPLHRAEYVLSLHKIIVNADAKDTIKPNTQILLEAMEMREQLEDVTSFEEIKTFEKTIKNEQQTSKQKIIELFNQELNTKNLEIIALETIRLKYISKFLEDIKSKVKGKNKV